MLYLSSSWLIRGHPFWEGVDASLHPSGYRILIINCITVSEQYVIELSGLHISGGLSSSHAAFLFLIFLSTEMSSLSVNSPSVMPNCLLIIIVVGSCVTFGVFPSRFWKYFHSFVYSCWFVAFNFALALLFLLLTSFIVCHAILDCLSSTQSLILSI